MQVVLADVDEAALARTTQEVQAAGARVRAVPTDVANARAVEALAQQTLDAFGAVHLLCNNAGIAPPTTATDINLATWDWVLGVNLWGVIHGLRFFLPSMLAQDTASHIVNTASTAGFISAPNVGAYGVAKHGIVTLSESLYHELAARNAKVKVSVLCPLWVNTRILEYERYPARGGQETAERDPPSRETAIRRKVLRRLVQRGMAPAEVAEHVFTAVREERFYILPHPDIKALVRLRMDDILNDRNPTNPDRSPTSA